MASVPAGSSAERAGAEWELVYGGRTRTSMAFLPELAVHGDRVTVVPQDERGLIDLPGLFRQVREDTLVYACGPEPLLRTLYEYFAASDVATEAARRLHVSVRTVTYRLARIRQLTGYGVGQPAERFALHTAVLGARLLDWPAQPLPVDP